MKRIYMAIITILCSIGIAIAISHAWFVNGYDVDPLATGSSADTYFYTGTGDAGDPYVITTPRHLYNLAWLQYLGRFNRSSESYKQYYFQIGNDDVTVTELDMTGWPLPPIGTTKYPFIGNFNGNGCKIQNLITTNNFTEFGTKHPEKVVASNSGENQEAFANCDVIGFFGAVGLYNQNIIANGNTATFDEDQKKANAVYDFYLDTSTVHTVQSATLLGVVAGYVNSTISDVAVISPALNIGSDVTNSAGKEFLSQYATVGYAEESFITAVSKKNTIVYNPTTSGPTKFTYKGLNGDSTGWGGSINMMEIYGRLKTEWNKYVKYSSSYAKNGQATFSSDGQTTSTNKPIQYYTNETIVYDDDGTTILNDVKTNGKDNIIGSGDNWDETEIYYNNAYVYQHSLGDYSDYHIRFYDASKSVSFNNQTYKTSSYSMLIEMPNKIGDSSGGYWGSSSYYGSSEWRYMCLTGYAEREMKSQLTLTENRLRTVSGFKLYNGSNYLSLGNYSNGSFTINNETTSDNATVWIQDGNAIYTWFTPTSTYNPTNASPVYTDGTVYNSIKFYLYRDGTNLRASTSSINWTVSNNKYSNNNYYIAFNGTNWYLETTCYYIKYGNNYLTMNSDGTLTNSTTESNATKWTLSGNLNTSGNSGTISTTLGGTVSTRYLVFDENTLSAETSQTNGTWYNTEGHFYRTISNTKYYLQYNNGWIASVAVQKSVTGYYIRSDNNYLSISNGQISNATSESEATLWTLSNNSTTNPGYISAEYNETTYYLKGTKTGNNTRSITLDTSSGSNWTVSNNKLRTGSYNNYVYVRFNSGWGANNSGTDIYINSGTKNVDDFNNTPVSLIANAEGITLSKLSNQNTSYRSSITSSNQNSPFTTPDTYIPLQADSNGIPTDKNTGYIISGAQFYENAYGDIRISGFQKDDLGNSLTSGEIDKTKVYTVNDSGNTVQISTIKSNLAQSGQNFDGIIDNLNETLSSTSQPGEETSGNIYGIHFMNATIKTSFNGHETRIPYAKINGDIYLNYHVPIDCIDFNLKEKGNVSFVAGTYYTNNNSFFSLYDIFRNKGTKVTSGNTSYYNNSTITNYKEISQIWSDNNDSHSYIYEYSDGTFSQPYYISNGVKYLLKYSGGEVIESTDLYDEDNRVTNSKNTGYTYCIFKTVWITQPGNMDATSTKKRAYYFEIPVNDGELALGSVSGKNGAYLMYLDLQANAQEIYRTKVSQKVTIKTSTLKSPNGIQIVQNDNELSSLSAVDGALSATAYITTANKGELSISKTSSTTYAIVGGGQKVSISNYVPSTQVLYTSTTTVNNYTDADKVVPTATSPPSSSQDILYLTYVDYNKAEKNSYITTIKQIGTNKTYTITNTDFETTQNNQTIDGNLWKLFDDQGNEASISAITVSTTGTTSICEYEYYTNVTTTHDMFVTTTINATTYAATATGNKIIIGPTAATGYSDSIRVSTKSASYTIYINDNQVSQNSSYSIVFEN